MILYTERQEMKTCYVHDYGARGDGLAKDTDAIQAAINDCGANGGGRVVLENGIFLTGRIDLRSGVELRIESDAILLGSTDGNDFPNIETEFWHTQYAPRFNKRCMIYAEGCENVAITGHGKINCQGDSYMEFVPGAEERGTKKDKIAWPYRRKAHPTDSPDGMVYYDDVPFPLDPLSVSLSPGRVVLFMGCKNVYVEDVTLENPPAAWGYWVCGCENVHFHRAQILANVLFPNNDGIHINCCRNVTISDCNIQSGDDGIVIRAYSLPLGQNTVCEKVAVTNCNITSHSGAVRIGWYGDGVIRNCTLSNLNITHSRTGISIYLPELPTTHRGSDEGEEDTLIENISFSNITMDTVFLEPIFISISNSCRCNSVHNLYFDNIHANSVHMPFLHGRRGCPVENIYITNSQFNQIDRATIPDEKFGPANEKEASMLPHFAHIKNLNLNNTVFHSLDSLD